MAQPSVHRFDPPNMARGDSHGGQGVLRASRVRGAQSGSSIHHVDLVVLEPGATIAAHRHAADNEEWYVVVSGHGQMRVEDDWVPVACGDVVPNPPGGQHGFCNDSDSPVWLVVIEVGHGPQAQAHAAAQVHAQVEQTRSGATV